MPSAAEVPAKQKPLDRTPPLAWMRSFSNVPRWPQRGCDLRLNDSRKNRIREAILAAFAADLPLSMTSAERQEIVQMVMVAIDDFAVIDRRPLAGGRPTKFTPMQIDAALAGRAAGKNNAQIAMILYDTLSPTPTQRRSVSSILKYHRKRLTAKNLAG